MSPARDYEARIAALERIVTGNPGIVSLKEHVETRLSDMDKFITESFASRDKAQVVAWDSLKAKMIDENHIRAQLQEQSQELVTKTEYRGDIKRLSDEVQQLREYRASMEGKASQASVIVSYLIGGAGLVLGIIKLFS